MSLRIALVLVLILAALTACERRSDHDKPGTPTKSEAAPSGLRSGYAPINGLNMYYEVQGNGRPLLLLHGGTATIDYSFAKMRPIFAKRWQTIAVEQQAHGHTADIDRPLTFEQMADDTAALLSHLKVKDVDVFGWSDGGNVALGLAIRRPELVRKVVVFGTNTSNEGLEPEVLKGIQDAAAKGESAADAEMPAGLRESYVKVAPDPNGWPNLFSKVMKQALAFPGWRMETLRAIRAPVLVMVGDHDIVRPEHAVELYRLIPNSQLAVLPGTDHFAPVSHPERLAAMVSDFLEASMPKDSGVKR